MSDIDVYWTILPERTVGEYAFIASCAVASRAGNMGYSYITSNYQRVDVARNRVCNAFRKMATNPNDVLVMMDCDHTHPYDVIERLTRHDPSCGVVGALAFRRGEPYFPCYFLRIPGHEGVVQPLEIPYGDLVPCAIVGTGAIAIRRWVLDELHANGIPAPFYYEYDDVMFETGEFRSEDITFGLNCEKLGIAHYCDTSVITPHLTAAAIDETAWNRIAGNYIAQYQKVKE